MQRVRQCRDATQLSQTQRALISTLNTNGRLNSTRHMYPIQRRLFKSFSALPVALSATIPSALSTIDAKYVAHKPSQALPSRA